MERMIKVRILAWEDIRKLKQPRNYDKIDRKFHEIRYICMLCASVSQPFSSFRRHEIASFLVFCGRLKHSKTNFYFQNLPFSKLLTAF